MNAAVLSLLPRGVWEADYLLRGCRVLLAVNRHNECIRRVRLRPGVDEEIARVWLEGLLERHDPELKLRLVVCEPIRSQRDTVIRALCARASLRRLPSHAAP